MTAAFDWQVLPTEAHSGRVYGSPKGVKSWRCRFTVSLFHPPQSKKKKNTKIFFVVDPENSGFFLDATSFCKASYCVWNLKFIFYFFL